MSNTQRKTIVIGHRNPDTDSIVSAIAYAELKRQQGVTRCMPARGGKLTPQTEYILKRFDTPAPTFIPDMLPKVEWLVKEREAQGLDFDIQVDGGVGKGNAADCVRAGANILVAGSSVMGRPDLKTAAEEVLSCGRSALV